MGWLSRVLGAPTSAAEMVLPVGAVLIDVRSPGEFASGHIDGAMSLPLDRIQFEIAKAVPDRATPLVLYCRSGARSASACGIVTGLGYAAVSNGGDIGSLSKSHGRSVTTAGQ